MADCPPAPARAPLGAALLLLSLQLLWVKPSDGSNWAQVTGPQLQNFVIPRIPNHDMFDSTTAGSYPGKNDHWSARRGHGIIITPKNESTQTISRVYILGGDSFVPDSEYLEHGGQYMNDVWYSEGVKWKTIWSYDDVDAYGKEYQKTYADMSWEQPHKGRKPPVGVSYDDWIQCQPAFNFRNNTLCSRSASKGKPPGRYTRDNMWSPRRHLGAVYFQKALWVLGGRSRTFVDIGFANSVGAVLGPRVESDPLQSKYREASVLMNDVWKSIDDGTTWTLVTPGCKTPQLDQILAGNSREGRYGSEVEQCRRDSDCYGNEYCNTTMSTCVCKMWSAREQHAVVADGQYMYVLGGFTSPQMAHCGPYACGNPWASAYTGYMRDIWRSKDGVSWKLVTAAAPFPGRGGHGVVVAPDLKGMFLVGGRTGNSHYASSKIYLNDVWYANLTSLDYWTANFTPAGFSGRAGHSLVYEPPTADNRRINRLYVIGGENDEEGILKDVWVWGLREDRPWAQDYSPHQFYHRGSGSSFSFAPNAPQQYYVGANTSVERVAKITLPTTQDDGRDIIPVPYLTVDQVEVLHRMGIKTITDMANADQLTILRLRGFDYPQVEAKDRMSFTNVCDFRALCLAILNKCQVHPWLTWKDGEKYLPRNIRPRFRKKGWPTVQHAQWYGADYPSMNPALKKTQVTDIATLIREWDGCSRLPPSILRPNVPGLGPVDQVEFIRDPSKELNELHCMTNPLPRTYLVGAYYQDKVFLFGGKREEHEMMQDTWYRDDRLPTAYIASKPASGTTISNFFLTADEEFAFFEYRIYNVDLFEEVKGWTKCSQQVDISWMNVRKGGPGTGNYIFYARAVDPAGNRDSQFIEGLNMYTWHYKNPLDWALILSLGGVGLVFIFAGYLEYRRRMKKRAMERYALKRMRRKFKGMQKDMDGKKTTDWRDLRKEKKKATVKKEKGKDKKKDKSSTPSKKGKKKDKSPKTSKKDKSPKSSKKKSPKRDDPKSKKDTAKKKKDK